MNSGKDFFYSLCYENVKYYQQIIDKNDQLKSISITEDVNLLNFICMLIMFVINCIAIIIVHNLEFEADYKVITPQDYTVLVSDIEPEEMSDDKQYLKSQLLLMEEISPIDVNLTFSISGYVEKKEEFKELKKKLRLMQTNKVIILNSN